MHPFIWTVHSVTIMQFTFPNPKLLLFGLNVKHIRGVFHVRPPLWTNSLRPQCPLPYLWKGPDVIPRMTQATNLM